MHLILDLYTMEMAFYHQESLELNIPEVNGQMVLSLESSGEDEPDDSKTPRDR